MTVEHLPEPSHLAATECKLLLQISFGHWNFGSPSPLSTNEQVPISWGLLVVPLQVLHGSAQPKLQHTPSVQIPLVHWLAAVQAAPFCLSPQEFPVQVAGEIQSVLLVQVDLHAPPAQMKFTQA